MASLAGLVTTGASEPALKKSSEIMQVKRLSENAVLPTRGSVYAAGKLRLSCVNLINTVRRFISDPNFVPPLTDH